MSFMTPPNTKGRAMDVKQSWTLGILMVSMTGGNIAYTGSRQTDPAEITANIEEDVQGLIHALDQLRTSGSGGVRELLVEVDRLQDQILILDVRGPQWVNQKLDAITDNQVRSGCIQKKDSL